MLDRRFIVQNIDVIRRNCAVRHVSVDLDAFLVLESRWRELNATHESLNQESKAHARALSAIRGKLTEEQLDRGRELKARNAEVEKDLRRVDEDLTELQQSIPNLTDPRAPIGESDRANTEIERGKTPISPFSFSPKDHVDLGEHLGILDLEAGSRVAGHGFYYLKDDAVLLDLALQQYVIGLLIQEKFSVVSTPDLARLSLLAGTGYNPRGNETQIYSIQGTDLGLIATAEITLAGLHADSVIDDDQLPILLCGLSHCFRTEAGAYGRSTRGLYRVHQFTKVEMFAFAHPEQSDELHLRILDLEKQIFDELAIPYRVVENATGDLGAAAFRKFDLEAWMPGRGDSGDFGEVTSASNCTDYQARRLNVRYREKSAGKIGGFVHTLNGTAVATGRAMIAILENCQLEDGSIRVPDVLRPFLGKDFIEARVNHPLRAPSASTVNNDL